MVAPAREVPSLRGRSRAPELWLSVLAISLTLAWTLAPGHGLVLALAGIAVGLAGLVLLRAPRARILALTLGATFVTPALLSPLRLSYADLLWIEAARAFLPLAGLALLARSARGRLLLALVLLLASLGSLVRVAETWLLMDRPGDVATIEHALRFDLAASLWSAAALAVAFALAARALAHRRPRRAHRTAVWAGALAGFVIVSSGGPALLEAGALPVPGLEIGFHASDVADVPDGASIVHLEASMPRVNPRPGEWRFDALDAQLDEAVRRGLDVYLLVSTYPPPWLQEAYPDAVMIDADGEPFHWIDEAPGAARARVWEMSFTDARVLAAQRAHVEAVTERYGHHPAVRWIAVQNEPAFPLDWNPLRWASFDASTVQAFRDALSSETHGDLDQLNDRYSTEFERWSDVRPPRTPFGDLGDRWIELREAWLVGHTRALIDAARDHTDRPVTTKLMAHFLTRFAEPQAGLSDSAYRALADMSDVVSVDLYPATRADLVRQLEYFDAIAHGKPLIVSEFNLGLGTHLPFAGTRMLSALETIGRYADAVILFTASGHYLYGIDGGSSAVAASRLAGRGFLDGKSYAGAFGELARDEWRELLSAPWKAKEALALAT